MDHKEMDVWKESISFVTDIYSFTKDFPKDEIYGLTSQIRRSAISIPSNIAEGLSRKSDVETIQFLYITIGSISELETQLIISEKIGLTSDVSEYIEKLSHIKKLTLGLVRFLKSKKK